MTVDLSSLPQKIELAVGERVSIPLPCYSGSGNVWSVTNVSGPEVARVSVEPAEIPPMPPSSGDGTAEPPELVLVPDRAVVFGLAPGEAIWRLVLARSFGPPVHTAVHDLHVTVAATP
jgi:hypothetical protein